MDDNKKWKNWLSIIAVILLVVFIAVFVYNFINKNNYYKQLQKTHDIAIKNANHAIDSLTEEKLQIRQDMVVLAIKNDSLQNIIIRLTNKTTQVKQNYEKKYNDIDNWDNDDIDKFFADRNKSKKSR